MIKKPKELTPFQLHVREKMMLLAEKEKLSLQDTADIFNNPITKQRVHQIQISARAKGVKL